jgi:glyoxylase-like metal-dependent hydrolase (beta-lactamase superfamily II)
MDTLMWKVGDVSITRIVESDVTLPIADLMPAATPSRLAAHRDWLQPHFIDDNDQIRLSFHSLVVVSGGKIIVVDTCIGEHGDPFTPDKSSSTHFLSDMANAGFPREKVDVVLCTHMHYDHVGWNTMKVDGNWMPTFPNARYLFANTEYKHWQNAPENPVTGNFNNAVEAVFDAGQADLVEMDHCITEEVKLVPTPGHSAGHVSVRIQSGGEQAFITGDMTHHPVQWAEPDWSVPQVDFDEQQGGETRRRIASELTNTETLVIGTHYPGPTAGYLVDKKGKIEFSVE